MSWDTVIGLEVHAQLKTKSKLFSGASTQFGAQPNSQTSFIDAGLPGVLPVPNEQAFNLAIRFGLAIEASIHTFSYFERKNYFYPDLPKGYQISQFRAPILSQGFLEITAADLKNKKVEIIRAHLEEDAGKSIHDTHPYYSGIDLNRSGTPLLEIVTSPCLYSAQEVIQYLKTLRQLLIFLNICDGNMQEGSFRCDVNISLKPSSSPTLGTRIELKNLNSFKFIEQAIRYEEKRQQGLLERGEKLIPETRLYSPETGQTFPMRSKENEIDYRYFPDPDLLPIQIEEKTIQKNKESMPRLPTAIKQELLELGAQLEDIEFLLNSLDTYTFFSQVRGYTTCEISLILNWLRGPMTSLLKDLSIDFSQAPISAKSLAQLLDAIQQQLLTHHMAKQIFKKLASGETDLSALIQAEKHSATFPEENLQLIIEAIIQKYPQQVKEYQAGKHKLLAFFVGQIMKQTQGQVEPQVIREKLMSLLTHLN